MTASGQHDARRIQEKVDAGLTEEQAIMVLDREAAARADEEKLSHRSHEAPGAAGRQARETERAARRTRDKRPNLKPNKGDTHP